VEQLPGFAPLVTPGAADGQALLVQGLGRRVILFVLGDVAEVVQRGGLQLPVLGRPVHRQAGRVRGARAGEVATIKRHVAKAGLGQRFEERVARFAGEEHPPLEQLDRVARLASPAGEQAGPDERLRARGHRHRLALGAPERAFERALALLEEAAPEPEP
jgi:hypothetical protein